MAAKPNGCGVRRLSIKSGDSWRCRAQGCLFLAHGDCVSPECEKSCPDCWDGVRVKRGANLLTLGGHGAANRSASAILRWFLDFEAIFGNGATDGKPPAQATLQESAWKTVKQRLVFPEPQPSQLPSEEQWRTRPRNLCPRAQVPSLAHTPAESQGS